MFIYPPPGPTGLKVCQNVHMKVGGSPLLNDDRRNDSEIMGVDHSVYMANASSVSEVGT